MLKIENLVKNYGKCRALNGLSMEVRKGELFGFIGPNGAGKTTTIKIMAGLLRADSGHVYLDGKDALKDADKLKQKIGYVPDNFGVYDNLKAIEYMEFYASTYGLVGKEVQKRCYELMEQVGLEGRGEVYVDELSRGMQQRLCLARAMIHKPDILILDEPASGLDPRSRFEMKMILKELCRKGATILISSHILSELAEMCSSIGIIKKGELLQQGSIEEIVSAVNISNPILLHVCDEQKKTLEFLKENPLVQTLAIDGKEFQFTFTGSVKEEAELLQQMIQQGIQVLSFGRKRDNLETIFMQLTKEREEG
ncbi:MAG: ABC transporter ATP-binding protein [Lachnospiraceae bacterium]|nr:ABC transporter ATP-binding protein [Lachnospiraceae bacterium]